MTLSSLQYLLFLPIVFLLYWLVFNKNKTTQNALILIASLFFYAYWDWRFLALLLLTALSTYYAGFLIQKADSTNRSRKWILIATLLLNVGILFWFKYYNFFVHSFVDVFSVFGKHLSFNTLKIIIPVGISFYTFTALSYTIDVYQRKIEATHDILAYLAYVTFFPSILSGPISRANKQLPQYFTKREFDYGNAVAACRAILWGLFMKLCVADRLGVYVDDVYSNLGEHNGTTLLITSVFYTIQIYADFAGYSLIAIGSGKFLGIELQNNFTKPYFANTVTDFWRRWHISLTTWFRDYIYFPLGGNRVKTSRWILNTLIVFVVSGLWHGAEYTFLIWGAFHGICMVIERLVLKDKIKHLDTEPSFVKAIRIVCTFAIVSFAWIFFRADNFSDSILVIKGIFTDIDLTNIYVGKGKTFIGITLILTALMFTKDYIEEHIDRFSMSLNNKTLQWGGVD